MRKIWRLSYLIPGFWLYRTFGWPRLLPINYIYNLTFRCNSKCKTCKIWAHSDDKKDELGYEDWQRIIMSIGDAPMWISLSGGEPFLFENIVELVKDIFFYNRPALLVIPTNGLLVDRISRCMNEIMKSKPKEVNLTINFSLDGVGKLHDEIRGIPGNFERVIESIKKMEELKKEYPDFTLGVHTVISKWNANYVQEIFNYVRENLCVDQHIFEIGEVRAEMFNADDAPTPSLDQYERFLKFWSSDKEVLGWRRNLKGMAKINDIFRRSYYKYLRDAIYLGRRKIIPSFAGFATAYITPWGDVWDCAVFCNVMGNLKDYDLNFRRFWKKSNLIRLVQGRNKVSHRCPFANENYINLLFSTWELLR